ncbi:MAG: glycosyltransferase [Candidatus Paceibacterota bacterium]|jgi:glycosyltransferase involved in cell wall biosynthesis
MRKILIFSTTYGPIITGTAVAIKEITDRIQHTRFDMVTLRCDQTSPAHERVGNVNIHRVGFVLTKNHDRGLGSFLFKINTLLFPLRACFRAHTLEKEHVYDAVWSVEASYAGFAALLFKYSHPKTPFILSLHEDDSIGAIKRHMRFIRPLYRRIFSHADCVQAVSQYLVGLARAFDFKGNVIVIPNGVDVKTFTREHSVQELNELKQKIGKHGSDIYIITVSRLVVKNGIDDIIRALVFLPERFKLLVVGEGEEFDALHILANEKKVADRVIYVGAVPYHEVPTYLKISDVFVRPSRSEGFGNAFIESMAAGTPVVATAVGGIVDFLYAPHNDKEQNIYQKPTGLFCGPHKPKTIADAVVRITENAELKTQLVNNGHDLAVEKYDWNIIARHMEKKVFDAVMVKNSL